MPLNYQRRQQDEQQPEDITVATAAGLQTSVIQAVSVPFTARFLISLANVTPEQYDEKTSAV